MKLETKQIKFFKTNGYLKIKNYIPLKIFDDIKEIISPWVDDKISNWLKDELISNDYAKKNFNQRFLLAWKEAGKPRFRRNPNKWLINKNMYKLLKNKLFISLASQLLSTKEISVHGIFNTRPQLPDTDFAKAPWHQDSQYWKMNYGQKYDNPHKCNVLTFFIPLQKVDINTGCLSVISLNDTKKKLFKAVEYDFKNTGYLGLSKNDIKKFKQKPIPMKLGDILVFNHLVLHGTNPLKKQHVRWSIDIRYEATPNATGLGKKFGFIASSENKKRVTKLQNWTKKSAK